MRVIKKPSLAESHPELAAQADGWDPKLIWAGSYKKKYWKCPSSHSWEASISNRSRNKTGCPICSNRKILVGLNDLETTHPELAKEADGWDPKSVIAGSHKKMRWKCQYGHTWITEIVVRKSGFKCPYCSNFKVLAGLNDLETTHPELAKEADGWDPKSVIAGSKKKMRWKCQFGHNWTATLNNRTSSKSGCPICANRTVLCGFNDLLTKNPNLAVEADGWNPNSVTISSGKKLDWKCKFGHQWKSTVANRSIGRGCPVCSHKKLLVGFNDLAATHPELAREADGWDPQLIVAGSHKRVRWKCERGHTWVSRINSRSQGRGCPSCSQTGFDPSQQGYLYFIDHFDLGMFQIGITNFPDDRLGRHKRAGWEVIELRGPMDGHLTQKLETDCLHALEKRGAILGHKAGIEKFDGYTEAWTKSSLEVTSIKQILDWVYEDEAGQ